MQNETIEQFLLWLHEEEEEGLPASKDSTRWKRSGTPSATGTLSTKSSPTTGSPSRTSCNPAKGFLALWTRRNTTKKAKIVHFAFLNRLIAYEKPEA